MSVSHGWDGRCTECLLNITCLAFMTSFSQTTTLKESCYCEPHLSLLLPQSTWRNVTWPQHQLLLPPPTPQWPLLPALSYPGPFLLLGHARHVPTSRPCSSVCPDCYLSPLLTHLDLHPMGPLQRDVPDQSNKVTSSIHCCLTLLYLSS